MKVESDIRSVPGYIGKCDRFAQAVSPARAEKEYFVPTALLHTILAVGGETPLPAGCHPAQTEIHLRKVRPAHSLVQLTPLTPAARCQTDRVRKTGSLKVRYHRPDKAPCRLMLPDVLARGQYAANPPDRGIPFFASQCSRPYSATYGTFSVCARAFASVLLPVDSPPNKQIRKTKLRYTSGDIILR